MTNYNKEEFIKRLKQRSDSIDYIFNTIESAGFLPKEEDLVALKQYAESIKNLPLASEDVLEFAKNLMGSSQIDDSCWLNTFSGKKIHPLNPNPEDICITDIAHALSHQCRFTGHTKNFYSIAQHCVLVSYLCNQENALYGLLHDASEYILVDIPSPLKKSQEFNFYREIEKKVQSIIYTKFGLNAEEPIDVKDAAIGYLIKAPKRAPKLITKPESARKAALAAARNCGRADVLALVPIGKAVRGAEWKEAA